MRQGVWLVSALLLFGCGSTDEDANGQPQPQANYVGARGITITQIAVYQGPKRVVMQDGAPATSNVPLVAGRPALVRVFHQTDAAYDGQPVLARLELPGQAPIEAMVGPLPAASVEEDFGSSVGFQLTGDQVGTTLDYTVSFLQDAPPEADNPSARFAQSVPVEGKKNKLRIVIVPYRYDADGSGRLPNTSPEQLEVFKHRFKGMYPVSDAEITVHEPVPWNQQIAPNGTGWQNVGLNLLGLKNNEGMGADVYYYGMFNPADNLFAYCGSGCLLGVTLLNDNPPDTGNVSLRLALGVGFDKEAPNTAAHEIGHAHGRGHVNCGFGIDPQSVEPGYPHDPQSIGGWSWDVVKNVPIDPSHSDIMGYCDKQWISDHNYAKLFVRTQNVNVEDFVSAPGGIAYDIVAIDGLGEISWLLDVKRPRPQTGERIRVRATHASGRQSELEAVFVRYDHLPGGWLFLPAGAAERVSLELDGKRISATRR